MGLHFKIFLAHEPARKTRAEQEALEQEIHERFSLSTHLASGLLQRVDFYWSPTGRLRRIHLVPHPRIRRTPGLADLEWLFYREAYHPAAHRKSLPIQRPLRRRP